MTQFGHSVGVDADFQGYRHGFWGPVDSTVDWCEANYVVTSYIAEFYNTVSSVPMIIWGIIGIVLTRKYCCKDLKYTAAFGGLGFVGLGSSAFHGTLRFHAQLLDELPMLYGTFALWYCFLFAHSPPAGLRGKSKTTSNTSKKSKLYDNETTVAVLMIVASIVIVM